MQWDAAGNMTQLTDPRSNITVTGYDGANNPIQVTLPTDSVGRIPEITYGINALNQQIAVNLPNANQSNTSLINFVGAGNLALNPGAEDVEPTSLQTGLTPTPRYWLPDTTYSSCVWATTGHAGSSREFTVSWLEQAC